MKWTPDLIIALVLICGCLALIFSGIDGEVKSILTMAAGWCFGNVYIQRTRGVSGEGRGETDKRRTKGGSTDG